MNTYRRALSIVDSYSLPKSLPKDGRNTRRSKGIRKMVELVNDRLEDAVITEEAKIRVEIERKSNGTDQD